MQGSNKDSTRIVVDEELSKNNQNAASHSHSLRIMFIFFLEIIL